MKYTEVPVLQTALKTAITDSEYPANDNHAHIHVYKRHADMKLAFAICDLHYGRLALDP